MKSHDRYPSNPDAELLTTCENLYRVMSEPFEASYPSLGYSIDVSATPKESAALYLPGGVKDIIESEFDSKLDQKGRWRILFHHDESAGKLRADTVSVPLIDRKKQQQSMIFKQLPKLGYLAFTETKGGNMQQWLPEDQQLEKQDFNHYTSPIVGHETMSEMLDEAGFRLEVPSAPESHLAITKGLDDIDNWSRRERIITPISPGYQLILTKESVLVTDGGRHDLGGNLTGYLEEVHDDNSRDQLVVHIPIDGGIVEKPKIVVRKITPSSDPSDVANYGQNAHKIKEETEIQLTPEMVDMIRKEMMAELGDIS